MRVENAPASLLGWRFSNGLPSSGAGAGTLLPAWCTSANSSGTSGGPTARSRRAPAVASPGSGKLRRVSRLLADAGPEDGDGARPRAADRFQVYPREARGQEADAVAEQHRQYIP